jgi:hypothetical protein
VVVQAPVLHAVGAVVGVAAGAKEGKIQAVGRASPPVLSATGVVKWATRPVSVDQSPRKSKQISLRRERRLRLCSCRRPWQHGQRNPISTHQ